jgi:putative ABC transport system ATP-binding protein
VDVTIPVYRGEVTLSDISTDDARPVGGMAVQVHQVRKTYLTSGGVAIPALDGVDLEIEAGSVTAVVGPSGSGKSTLLHLVGGMDRPDSGTITCGGAEITSLSRQDLVSYRRTVGFVFQSFALLPALTARDNVMLPVIPYDHDASARVRADELLAQVGLAGRENALPSQLSGGERQRVAIARALMNRPRLLVADEPTGNLDSATGDDIIELLLGIRSAVGTTILVATHDPRIAARCDSVVPVADGRITHPPGVVRR